MNSNNDDRAEHSVTTHTHAAVSMSPSAIAFPDQLAAKVDDPRSLAGPWSRYWARSFDVLLWFLLLDLPLAWYVPHAFDKPFAAVTTLATLPFTMLVDAIVYSLCGNTPGKSLAGLRVVDESGARLEFVRYLKRNLQLYVHGLALGISIVAFFTLISAYRTLVEKRRLSWDQNAKSLVLQLRPKWWRSWFVASLYIGIGAGAIYLGALMKSPEAEIRIGVAAANATKSTMVDEGTRFDGAEALPERTVQYNFTLLTEDADEPDQTYREAFEADMRKSVKNNICTSDDIKPFRDIGTTFRYRFSNRYGGLVGLISVPSGECAQR